MKQEIVKAEILWTYACPRSCSGCSMNTGERNSKPLSFWKQGFQNLKALGCSFVAFYGAEPLADFNLLPAAVESVLDLGMETTVITSYPDYRAKLSVLYDVGLRSLTTSYDIIPYDKHSDKKSKQALRILEYWRSLGPVRDTAAVVTITRQNFRQLPETVLELSDRGIWTFCDLMHWDRGQEGTKCKGKLDPKLHLQPSDLPDLVRVMNELMDMRKQGYLLHWNNVVTETIEIDKLRFVWNCADYHQFPSWVTVGPDGFVYPCDDFKPVHTRFSLDMLLKRWDEFAKFWKPETQRRCTGCLWCTHIQAHAIKLGIMDIGDYVHGQKNSTSV